MHVRNLVFRLTNDHHGRCQQLTVVHMIVQFPSIAALTDKSKMREAAKQVIERLCVKELDNVTGVSYFILKPQYLKDAGE